MSRHIHRAPLPENVLCVGVMTPRGTEIVANEDLVTDMDVAATLLSDVKGGFVIEPSWWERWP